MPEKTTGWRKKMPTRPSALRLGSEVTAAGDGSNERLYCHSERLGRKSRPETPASLTTPQTGLEDARGDTTSEASTPRRTVRPKFSRYLSGYRSLKDGSKDAEFRQPWSEDAPPPYITPIDPLMSLNSVYSYMNSFPTKPIPIEYNSNLFRIFEDYCKVRHDKDTLDELLQQTFDGFRHAEEFWAESESQYEEEIRRLELLIARDGSSGMAGLVKARQDSVLKRRRGHRKTVSTDRLLGKLGTIPSEEIDEQIRIRSKEVLLHRPSSPSGRMVALSRRFTASSSTEDLVVGTPPSRGKITLMRKVKSELDLINMRTICQTNLETRSVESGFSRTGDPLPDEIEPPAAPLDATIDCDAVVALRELGTLVARKRGINTARFLHGLTQLFVLNGDEGDGNINPADNSHSGESDARGHVPTENDVDVDPKRIPLGYLRHFCSQPALASEKRCRRHFSFEPGDDQLKELDVNLFPSGSNGRAFSADSTSKSAQWVMGSTPQPESLSTQVQSLSIELQKPSKVPNPVQRPRLGSIRQDSSVSSLQTIVGKQYPGHHRDSSSGSIFPSRENSTDSVRPAPGRRSGFDGTHRHGQGQQPDQPGILRVPTSVAALASAWAPDHVDSIQGSKNSSPRHADTLSVSLSTRTVRRYEKTKSENDGFESSS